MPPNQTQFSIVYDGPSVDNHSIDVEDLYKSLTGLRDMVHRVQELANPRAEDDKSKIHKINLRINAVQPGSFELVMALADYGMVDHLQQLFQKYLTVADVLTMFGVTSDAHPESPFIRDGDLPQQETPGADEAGNDLSTQGSKTEALGFGLVLFKGGLIIRSYWQAIKFLDGKPAKDIREDERGSIVIINHKNESQAVDIPFIGRKLGDQTLPFYKKVFSDGKLNRHVHKFVNKIGSGVARIYDGRQSRTESAIIADEGTVDKLPPSDDDGWQEKGDHVNLTLLGANIDGEKSAWRFKWNGATISASVDDENFLAEVKEGLHRFGNGDSVSCYMKWQQLTQNDIDSKRKYVIEEIYSVNGQPIDTNQSPQLSDIKDVLDVV